MDFTATIEFLKSGAIVALFDFNGACVGASRIETPRAYRYSRRAARAVLYERGYNTASASAAAKGGRLARYAVEVAA